MDSFHRDLIQQHTLELLDGINDVEIILDHLYAERIFIYNTIERIMVSISLPQRKESRRDRTRELLRQLETRPTSDFPKFVKVLRATGQGHMADLLDSPGVSAQARPEVRVNPDVHSVDYTFVSSARKPTGQVSEEGKATSVLALGEDYIDHSPKPPYSLPEVWPVEAVLREPVRVRPVTQKEMKLKWEQNKRQKQQANNNDSMYTMCGRRRAIIISNKFFHDSKYNRYGNEFDEKRIMTLLEILDFDVEVWRDKTEKELFGETGLLSKEARKDRDDYQCFLMVILSHGQKDIIMTADNVYVPVKEIVDYFETKRSHQFAMKPKIFLVQACQGDTEDEGASTNRLADVTEKFNGMNLETTDSGTVPRDADKLATFSDVIIVNATAPGFVAFRNTKYGTWFIQAVIEVFSNLACEDDLMTMLVKVCNLLSRGRTQNGKHFQISNIADGTLTKKVYFFPGLK